MPCPTNPTPNSSAFPNPPQKTPQTPEKLDPVTILLHARPEDYLPEEYETLKTAAARFQTRMKEQTEFFFTRIPSPLLSKNTPLTCRQYGNRLT